MDGVIEVSGVDGVDGDAGPIPQVTPARLDAKRLLDVGSHALRLVERALGKRRRQVVGGDKRLHGHVEPLGGPQAPDERDDAGLAARRVPHDAGGHYVPLAHAKPPR